jgi:hypothetical protein
MHQASAGAAASLQYGVSGSGYRFITGRQPVAIGAMLMQLWLLNNA